MTLSVKTNRTKSEPEHRLTLTVNETRNFVLPRFKYINNGKFKVIIWTGKNGLKLHYKKNDDGTVKVGFEEPGYGVAETYYTINDLENLMMPF